ncbi:glutamate/aspartate transport system substrate-binding protein [Agrobacterium larrymoorei]|uniref:Glutamate/aspartate transport system substrate-binding protein n=1 Tax=Agrobacterium larrymoorei TaxID=160699 RepID=A0AAJ2B8U5_9HYPH|nr:amino acid ABC transporter substrate-binding protein [Agrobacterium larrymoorei]MDR6101339.1 glutamate/aspartate transport system substrate-binding protein [Agrobacterium larrymoorei]
MEFFHIFRYFWSRRSRFLSAPLTLLACNFPLSLTAQAGSVANSTVDKIKQTKTITIGHRTDGVPFSYVTADGTVAGYSIDICKEVAEYIRDALKLDRIKVDYAVATPGTRFVLVKSGKVDMECAATTNNAERRKQVAFSYPHFYSATRFVAKKSSGFNTIQDLAGRSVASTTGTINIEQLQDVNRTHNLNISVLIAKVDSEGFAMVKNNRASAFVMDDVLLAGQVAFSDAPEEYAISQDKFGPAEPYGIMLPKDDVAFKTLVNEALYKIYTSGEINSIYDKWFMSPVPPMNRNFNLPISEELRAEFKNPAEYDQ